MYSVIFRAYSSLQNGLQKYNYFFNWQNYAIFLILK